MRRLVPLAILVSWTSFLAAVASAQTCAMLLPIDLDLSRMPEAEKLRVQSIELAKRFAHHEPDEIVVVGEFAVINGEDYRHESILEEISDLLLSDIGAEFEKLRTITFSYFSAFSFDGYQLIDGSLRPFESDSLDYEVTLVIDHILMIDRPIATNRRVIGVLKSNRPLTNRYVVESHYCGAYHSIDQAQLDDLLACYREGECLDR